MFRQQLIHQHPNVISVFDIWGQYIYVDTKVMSFGTCFNSCQLTQHSRSFKNFLLELVFLRHFILYIHISSCLSFPFELEKKSRWLLIQSLPNLTLVRALYYIISYHIIPYHAMPCHVPCHSIAYHTIPYHTISYITLDIFAIPSSYHKDQ